MDIKIRQAESQFARKLTAPLADALRDLQYFLPERYRLRISLLDANGRKKRSSASAENWSPESGRIEISFETTAEEKSFSASAPESPAAVSPVQERPSPAQPEDQSVHPAERELVGALDRAESRPGWSFVPLRKFRDEILPAEQLSSMQTDIERQNVLRSAIDKRLVLVGKVPNPKAPEFPVTTIRLNRLMPAVQRLIGGGRNADQDFCPIDIPGESLSATVLRERR